MITTKCSISRLVVLCELKDHIKKSSIALRYKKELDRFPGILIVNENRVYNDKQPMQLEAVCMHV